MTFHSNRRLLAFSVIQTSFLCVAITASRSAVADNDTPDFGREVRPILAKHCFTCHGPDEGAREAGLRLDVESGAKSDLGGYRAVEPNRPEDSEIIARISSDDEGTRMPPADSHPPLSKTDISILTDWIRSGGDYTEHWSFQPPKKVAVPKVKNASWCRNPIDAFVLRRIEDAGLHPAPESPPAALLRRLYLDLTGSTPTLQEADQFLADDHPSAYQRLVDRLLASPAYGERFARNWLDLARYADTNGYEKDRARTIWPYRDWVIDAIAQDKPFDQFSVEQLAGDMLPGATRQQRVATGFHRNTMINEEGGIDPLEYRFYAMVDRVATTGTVWLGLTTGCAQCHTHKYDPITHTDYYSLFALMNQADEPDLVVSDAESAIKRRSIEKQITAEEEKLVAQYLPSQSEYDSDQKPEASGSERTIAESFATIVEEAINNVRDWKTIRPTEMESTMPILRVQKDGSILATGDVTKRDVYRLEFEIAEADEPISALRLEVLPHPSLPAGGPGMAFYEGRRGDFFLSELSATLDGKKISFDAASHSYGKISVGSGNADAANVIDGEGSTGWSTAQREGEAHRLILNLAEPIEASDETDAAQTLEIRLLFERHFAAALGRFRFSVSHGYDAVTANKLPAELDQSLSADVLSNGTVSKEVYMRLQREFVRSSPELKEKRKRLDRLRASVPEPVRTMVLRERPRRDRRETHRHHRGEYLNAKEVVSPAVPVVFGGLGDSMPADRLGLAKWLVSDKNPLVGRVTANRAWRALFGTGIVRTSGDFGTQSEPPSHPQLLDWLAQDLRDGGWSIKRLHRQIVTSATYRQSVTSPAEGDPNQRLLVGFPHRRLDAEQVRDTMLSAAGLMTHQVGGPSVYPPQPTGVFEMAYGGGKWPTSSGANRYRRSIYTFSKRTAPFAAFASFDAPTGELCVARRDRSTTPLQALTLMNDEMYLEIARGLAESTLRGCDEDARPKRIAAEMFRRMFVREPSQVELDAIVSFYDRQNDHEEPWTLVARALMNTDEAITTP